MTTPAITGTVSSGTLKVTDLIEAFHSALQVLNPAWAAEIAPQIERGNYPDESLAWLFDALAESMPPGWRFGTLEGDGAEFGIWPDEEEV